MSQEPIRVLHLTASSDTGGTTRYIYDLCEAMRRRGHHVAVAGRKGTWQDLFNQAQWQWIDVPLDGGPAALCRAVGRLKRYLDEHPVDLLHAHYRKAAIVGRRLARASGAPLLFTLHLSHIPMSTLWRWLSDFGDHTHAVSTEAARWLTDAAGLTPDHITVINNGIDTSRYLPATEHDRREARESFGLPPDATVAAYVGRLTDSKNPDWLIDLAAASSERLPGLHILVAGDGPLEPTMKLRIEQQRLADRIHLLGHRDPLAVYQAADALLLPSAIEGFGLVCAEAMAVGVPVLRTRTSGTEALVVEGETGRSTPIDRRAFIDAATDFLSNRQELRRMGQHGIAHVADHLTAESQLERTLGLYRRMIGRTTIATGAGS